MKRLLTRQSYLNVLNTKHYTKYTGIEPINEAAFANDAPWGDTLVGRLINSFARKGKIAFNKRRISGLSSRLKSIFDEMLEIGSVEITGDSTNTILYLKISSLLGELTTQVKEEEDIEILISTTEELIDNVTVYEYDGKDIMLKALEEFLKYLKELKKSGDPEDSDERHKSKDEGAQNELYLQCKSFLQSVISLHDDIKMNVVRFKSKEYGQDVNLKTQFDLAKFKEIKSKYEKAAPKDKLAILRQLVQMCEDGLDAYKAKGDKVNIGLFNKYFNEYVGILSGMERDLLDAQKAKKSTQSTPSTKPADKETTSVSKEKEKVTTQNASYIYEEANPSTGIANVEGNEQHAKNAWNKVITAYNQSKIASFITQIEELVNKTSKGDKVALKTAKEDIIKICKQCVLNKLTVGKPISFEELIKESVNINDVSKSISLFGRILLAFKEDLGLAGAYGKVTQPLNTFVTSFGKLEKMFQVKKDEVKPEEKKESLLRYQGFLMLNEKNKFPAEIKSKFDEIFTKEIVEYFNITEAKMAELNKTITEREGDAMVFTSADPIIEIVRLFNRAWRIHTPGVIPSGRTGVRVSNSVFREYENLGEGSSGTPNEPGNGPYRNIELYDSWFEAVQDILSDTKYRPIFSENVIFRFVNEETGQEGDEIKKGGKILLKFINDLIGDSKMYKAGAMNKFLTDYFKLDPSKIEAPNGIVDPQHPNDGKENDKTSTEIKITDVDYKTMDRIDAFNSSSGNLNRLFTERLAKDYEKLAFRIDVEGKEEKDVKRTYYCVYDSTVNGYPVFLFSSDNYAYDMTKVSGISKANTPKNAFLGVLEKLGDFKVNGTANVRFMEVSVDSLPSDTPDRVPFKITKLEILCKKDTKEPYLDFSSYLPGFKSNITKNLSPAKTKICKP